MRVLVDALYLTNRRLRGIGRYSQTLCRLIRQHDVAELFVLISTVKPSNVFNLTRHLRGTRYKMILLPIPGRFFQLLRTKCDLYNALCKVFGIDLFHVPYETFYRTRFPNIMTVHGMEPFSNPSRERFFENFRSNLRKSAESVWTYISVSSMVKKELIQYLSLKEDKVFEIPIPLDDVFFSRSAKWPGDEELRMLYYGGFEDNKNLRNLVQALDNLYNSSSIPFSLSIVGDYRWHAERSEPFLHRPYLRMLDYLDHSELITEILSASCVIFPSLYEGFGLPLVESLSLRTPVLTSKNVGALSYVNQGFLVFDPLDQEDIIRTILKGYNTRNDLHRAAERESLDLRQSLSFQRIGTLLKEAYFTTLRTSALYHD